MGEMQEFNMPRVEQDADRLLEAKCAMAKERVRQQEIKEAMLETAEIKRMTRLNSTNEVLFTEFKDGGLGIFKPKEGEDIGMRKHVPAGEYYKRERASYLVDKYLGIGLVRPTVIREIDGRVGSVQEFVTNAKSGFELTDEDRGELADDFYKLGILDFAIWSSDRGKYNYLQDGASKELNAIDNALTFGKDIMTIPESYLSGRKAPSDLVQNLDTFTAWDEGKDELAKQLKELMPEEEATASMHRIEFISTLLREHGEIDEKTLNAMLDNELYDPK